MTSKLRLCVLCGVAVTENKETSSEQERRSLCGTQKRNTSLLCKDAVCETTEAWFDNVFGGRSCSQIVWRTPESVSDNNLLLNSSVKRAGTANTTCDVAQISEQTAAPVDVQSADCSGAEAGR